MEGIDLKSVEYRTCQIVFGVTFFDSQIILPRREDKKMTTMIIILSINSTKLHNPELTITLCKPVYRAPKLN